MASYTTKFTKTTVYSFLRREMRRRTKGLEDRPNGVFLIDTGTLTFDGSAILNDAGDEFELLEMPDACKVYLLDLAIDHSDWDGAGPELTIDLIFQNAAGTETVIVNESLVFAAGTTPLTIAQATGTESVAPTLQVAAWKPMYDVSGHKIILETGTDAHTDVTSNTVRGKFLVYCCSVGSTLTGA